MKIDHAGLPFPEYEHLLDRGSLGASSAETIRLLIGSSQEGLLLFGKGKTSEALRDLLGPSITGTIDSSDVPVSLEGKTVVLATAPLHYRGIIGRLQGASPSRVVTLFDGKPEIPVRLIFETQPRSGTHYVIDNLTRLAGLGYASVFHSGAEGLKPSQDGRYSFVPGAEGYLIKAHFTRPLHFPEYRYLPVVFQVGYPFDCLHSLAKMISDRPDDPEFRLRSDSREWHTIRSYFPLNLQWLDYVADRETFRYEDYYLDFGKVVSRWSRLLGGADLSGFERPRRNDRRCYWSGGYDDLFEPAVRDEIAGVFGPAIRRLWPEKGNEVT